MMRLNCEEMIDLGLRTRQQCDDIYTSNGTVFLIGVSVFLFTAFVWPGWLRNLG